jgi:hypothetical protein
MNSAHILNLINNEFHNCNASLCGKNIFIISSKLEVIATRLRFGIEIEINDDNDKDYCGMENENREEINLKNYLKDDMIYINEGDNNSNECNNNCKYDNIKIIFTKYY